MFSGKLPFETEDDFMGRVERGEPPSLPSDFMLRVQGGERPSLPSDNLSRRRGLTSEMEDLIRDCWAQDPTNRPSAEQVAKRLHVLCTQPTDETPLDKMAALFHAKVLHDQRNPFIILNEPGSGIAVEFCNWKKETSI